MAFATALKKTVSDGVSLTLSQAEAEALRLVLANIGGPPDTTPRKHTDAVLRTLKNAGINTPAGGYVIDSVLRFAAPDVKSNPFRFDPYTMTSSANPFNTRLY